MKYIIDTGSHIPAYQQLYARVREDIINGIYPVGSKIPSKRTVALDSNVSTVTVEHAYALLCDEGYIESRERSGFFVIFRAEDGFVSSPAQSNTQAQKPRPAHQGDTHTDFPFSVLAKTMRKVISDNGEGMLERSPNLGTTELREAIRVYLAQNRGILADIDQIVIGSGSEYLYTLLVELLGRDKIYAIESPSYKKIEQVYRAAEINYESLSLTPSGIDSSALNSSKSDILHTTPYRSYPSGVTATASKRHEYLRWANEGEKYIIEDDFESEFSVSTKPTETLFALSTKDNVIYLNTFSKTISPSLRIGYMVLPKHLVEVYDDKLGFYSCTVPTFMQYVLTELIDNGDFKAYQPCQTKLEKTAIGISKALAQLNEGYLLFK